MMTADRRVFLSQRERLDLTILSEGDPLLRNPYAVIVVSSEKHPGIHVQAARQLSEFLLSPKVQRAIGAFGLERFGQPCSFPSHLQNGELLPDAIPHISGLGGEFEVAVHFVILALHDFGEIDYESGMDVEQIKEYVGGTADQCSRTARTGHDAGRGEPVLLAS